jgi:CheY-like chemotaxis protein
VLLVRDYLRISCYESPVPAGGFSDAPGSEEHERSRSEGLKVLVVDDESTIAETLVEILNGEGFQAMAAGAADSALAMARTFEPDVVVTDVVMPGLSGVELGVRIRQMLPTCRVILFSGQTATVDLLKEARKHGHEFEIVAKPIKPETFLAMIRHPRGN